MTEDEQDQQRAEQDQQQRRASEAAAAYAQTLTGWDEIAIRKAFGRSLDDLDANGQVRAVTSVRFRREGQGDKDAYAAAMGATIRDLRVLWAGPDPEAPAQPQAM